MTGVNQDRQRLRLGIGGVVQGVGFRPVAYRLAEQLGLSGQIKNLGHGVELILEGSPDRLQDFQHQLPQLLPRQASMEIIQRELLPAQGLNSFTIVASRQSGSADITLAADLATCPTCVEEFNDPADPRYQYPFISCSECGPRYTVVESMPWDRERTSLKQFPLCAHCASEYNNPRNRRFHAETTACHKCGPTLSLYDGQWQGYEGRQQDIIARVREAIAQGEIVAVRGIGGYQLVCDASNTEAIARLRDRKQRPHKPLAVMARNRQQVEAVCRLDKEEATMLSSPVAPIIILDDSGQNILPTASLSPDSPGIGFMLPTSALHLLLFGGQNQSAPDYLVVTSGNARGEPICRNDSEARARLDGLADWFLTHDRDIVRVCDDSVFMKVDGQLQVIRRARGLAPGKNRLPKALPYPVLSQGADLKNTVGLAEGNKAMISPHLGDLAYLQSLKGHRQCCADLSQFSDFNPGAVVVDLHPEFYSSVTGEQFARENDLELIAVQHHHAHAAACMAENDLEQAIALVFDGSGYGTDGSIWGGECLYVDGADYQRLATFQQTALMGGAHAIINPVRQAIVRLFEAQVEEGDPLWPLSGRQDTRMNLARQWMNSSVSKIYTSSVGRLFDAVSALLDLGPERISYEGQAAIRLETLAEEAWSDDMTTVPAYPYELKSRGDLTEIQTSAMIRAICSDLVAGVATSGIALKFHQSLSEMAVSMVVSAQTALGEQQGKKAVALSGGVFQNRLLTTLVRRRLEGAGFKVYRHTQVPSNDGGIAFGQLAVVASANQEPVRG